MIAFFFFCSTGWKLVLNISSDPIIYSGSHNQLNATSNGFYLGPDGLSISSSFVISANGSSIINHEGFSLGNWIVTQDNNNNIIGMKSRNNNRILLDSEHSLIVLGSNDGKIYSGPHNALDSRNDGFYLSNLWLSIEFLVLVSCRKAGELLLIQGNIGLLMVIIMIVM